MFALVRDVTERKLADEALRESEARYRTLFDTSKDAIYIITREGKVVDVNQATLDLFGYTREEMMQLNTAQVYADPEDRVRFQREIGERGSVRDFEERLRRADGMELICLVTATVRLASDGSKVGYQGIIRDITERKRMEEALRASEAKFRGLFENLLEGVYQSSPQGRYLSANPAFVKMLGYESEEELLAVDARETWASLEDRDRWIQHLQEKGELRNVELILKRKDGHQVTVLENDRAVRDEKGRLLYREGVVTDITDRKRAEEAMIRQTRELAVLEERNRMAREIHDTLAQGFTGIVLQLEAAEQVLDDGTSEVHDHLSRAKGLARESLQEARRSVWDLVPKALEERPLEAALREEVSRFEAEVGGKASFHVSGQARELSSNIQSALLRICQESITNVMRHAKATQVKVQLSFLPEAISLRIEDDGIGFAREIFTDATVRTGFGFTGMEQRARLLGGTLDVSTCRGQGTVVEAVMPSA